VTQTFKTEIYRDPQGHTEMRFNFLTSILERTAVLSSFVFCLSSFNAPHARGDASTQPQPLPERVQTIFATHCAECHGETVAHPRGNFGYITNLARVAADTELITPGKPEQSQLWQMIKSGEMPARGAKAGPLSADEKESIRKWIESGATVSSSEPTGK